MSFSTILFTEKGRALQAKAIAGAALTFTKIEMGSGSLGGQSQVTLSALIDTEVILPINEIKRNLNYATVKGIFSNADISIGFYWREIGVFAQDPDLGEILYCYGNAGALAEYIPPQTSEIIEKVVGLSIIVGNASSVSAVINETLALATKEDILLINGALHELDDALGEVISELDSITSTYTSNTGNDSYAITIDGISNQAELLGKVIKFRSTTPNTTSCTLNVNGHGAYAICKDVSAALETGDILANSVVSVVWDGTRYQILELNNVVTKAGTQTLTNKTFTAPKMTSASSINDASGNELIKFPSTVSSAVNEITVSNAATGNAPSLQTTGGDTNIPLDIKSKGTGLIRHYINGVLSVVFDAMASAVNYLAFKSNIAGSAPTVNATGTDANININMVPKGSGRLQEKGNNLLRQADLANNCVTTADGLALDAKQGKVLQDQITAQNDNLGHIKEIVKTVLANTNGANVSFIADSDCIYLVTVHFGFDTSGSLFIGKR